MKDRFWLARIALAKNPLVKTRTFWGEPITVKFDEYRSIVHDGLIDSKEFALTAYLMNTLTAHDVFFDVGANVGFYTLLASALGAKVTAFEPMPHTFNILRRNAPHATLVNEAVMDTDGPFLFADYGAGAGLNKVLIGEEAAHTLTIKATTLDAYCRTHNTIPTIIKIDAENTEAYVIAGGLETIQTYRPVLIVEGNERIIETLQSLGYDAFQLQDDGHAVPYKKGEKILNDNLLFKPTI